MSQRILFAKFAIAAVRQELKGIWTDNRGSAFIFAALGFTVLMGFAGMGIDLTHWYAERRITQNLADAAAVAATYVQMAGGNDAAVFQAAMEEAIRQGYQDVPGNSVFINTALAAGVGGATPRVEVIIRREAALIFTSSFLDQTFTIAGRAVGGSRALGTQCVIALDETAHRSLEFSGNTTANVGCGVASNSNSAEAIYVGGNAELTANPAQANGDIVVTGSGQINSTYPLLPFSPRVPDPFANYSPPPPSGSCDFTDKTVSPNSSLTISPGGGEVRFCGNTSFQGTVTLGAGTYYFDGGDLTINAGATVTGTGVTLILTGPDSENVATMRINGNAEITLTAPAAGPNQGMVIYQDRMADTDGDNRLNGGSTMNLTGAVYFPRQPILFSGGNDINGCTQIVARTVGFTGNSVVANDVTACENIGIDPAGVSVQQQVVLVE